MSKVFTSGPAPATYNAADMRRFYRGVERAINMLGKDAESIQKEVASFRREFTRRQQVRELHTLTPVGVIEWAEYTDAGTDYVQGILHFSQGWGRIDNVQYRSASTTNGGNVPSTEAWIDWDDGASSMTYEQDSAYKGGGYYRLRLAMPLIKKGAKNDTFTVQIRALDADGAVWFMSAKGFDPDKDPEVDFLSLTVGNWDEGTGQWELIASGNADLDTGSIAFAIGEGSDPAADASLIDADFSVGTTNFATSDKRFNVSLGTFDASGATEKIIYVVAKAWTDVSKGGTGQGEPYKRQSIYIPRDPFDSGLIDDNELTANMLEDVAKRASVRITGRNKSGFESATVQYAGRIEYNDDPGTPYLMAGDGTTYQDLTPSTTGVNYYVFFDPSGWYGDGSGTAATQLQITTDESIAKTITGRRLLVGIIIAVASPERAFYSFTSDTPKISAVSIDVVDLWALNATIGGFDIGEDYVRDAANTFGLSSTVTGGNDVRFWAGDTFANRASAPVRIYEDGDFHFGSTTQFVNWNGSALTIAGGVSIIGSSTMTATLALSDPGKITVGTMGLGYGVNGANDGLYIDASNYWYTTGAFRMGGSTGITYAGSGAVTVGTNVNVQGNLTGTSMALSGKLTVNDGVYDRVVVGNIGATYGMVVKDAVGNTVFDTTSTTATIGGDASLLDLGIAGTLSIAGSGEITVGSNVVLDANGLVIADGAGGSYLWFNNASSGNAYYRAYDIGSGVMRHRIDVQNVTADGNIYMVYVLGNTESNYFSLNGSTFATPHATLGYIVNNAIYFDDSAVAPGGAAGYGALYADASEVLKYYVGTAGPYTVWHSGNDGATSGLDADFLDGLHGSSYQASHATLTTLSGLANAVGYLYNNGSGTLSWSSVGTGSTTFAGLTDTPGSFSGAANYFVRVNGTPNALEFVAASSINVGAFNNDGTYQAAAYYLSNIATLTDPNDDRILFFDDSVGVITWLDMTNGIYIDGTNLRLEDALVDLRDVGVVSASDMFLVSSAAGTWSYETATQVRTTIGAQASHATLTALSALANASGVLTNNGAGVLSWAAAGGSGTVTSVATGTGLSGGTITTSGTITLDFNALAASGTLVGTDNLVVVDGTLTRKTQISTIPLSIFNNNSGWTSNAGTVTSVTANAGITVATGTTTPVLTLDLGGLTVSAGGMISSDYFIITDGGLNRKIVPANINVGWFFDDGTYQAKDAHLDDLAALATVTTSEKIMLSSGSGAWAYQDGVYVESSALNATAGTRGPKFVGSGIYGSGGTPATESFSGWLYVRVGGTVYRAALYADGA